MKKVIRISKFCILSGIIYLLFSFSASSQTYQDSCRILVEDYDKTIVENPDSVMIDTCLCPDVHWSECKYLYAKQWYEITFPVGAIHLPYYPNDTTIFIKWEDVDTNFQDIRDGLYELQNIFGNYKIKKVYPEIIDTTRLASRFFRIRFEEYCKIDSVVSYLENINNIETGYKFHVLFFPDDVDDKDKISANIYPNPASEFIEITVGANGSSPICETYIQIYNVFAVQMAVGEHCPYIIGMPLRIDISHFPNGLYFLRIADEIQKFVVLR